MSNSHNSTCLTSGVSRFCSGYLTGFPELDRQLVKIITIVQLRNLIQVSKSIYLNLKQLDLVQDLSHNVHKEEMFIPLATRWIAQNNGIRLLNWFKQNPNYKIGSVLFHLRNNINTAIKHDSFDVFIEIVNRETILKLPKRQTLSMYFSRLKHNKHIIRKCVKYSKPVYLEYLAGIKSDILFEQLRSGFLGCVKYNQLGLIRFFIEQSRIKKIQLMHMLKTKFLRVTSAYIINCTCVSSFILDYTIESSIKQRKSDLTKVLLQMKSQQLKDKKKEDILLSWTFSDSSRLYLRICWKLYFVIIVTLNFMGLIDICPFLRKHDSRKKSFWNLLKFLAVILIIFLCSSYLTCRVIDIYIYIIL